MENGQKNKLNPSEQGCRPFPPENKPACASKFDMLFYTTTKKFKL